MRGVGGFLVRHGNRPAVSGNCGDEFQVESKKQFGLNVRGPVAQMDRAAVS